MNASRNAWLGLALLGLIWGSSYLLIRIGIEQVPPFQLVFLRTAIAALGLNVVLKARGLSWPRDGRSLRAILILGIVNTVVPFTLITWGEKYIASSLAGILQGTAVLFSMLIAHFVFVDERLNGRKLAGCLIGFFGVAVLASRSGDDAQIGDTNMRMFGQLAVVAASLCYAIGGAVSRQALQGRIQPLMASAGAMTVATVLSGLVAYGLPGLAATPVSLSALRTPVAAAVIVLGIWNTFGAYLIYYALIEKLGAARTSMVAYIIPAVSLALGALFLHEPIDTPLLIGSALIVGGIALVSLKLGLPRKFLGSRVATS